MIPFVCPEILCNSDWVEFAVNAYTYDSYNYKHFVLCKYANDGVIDFSITEQNQEMLYFATEEDKTLFILKYL